MRVYYIGVGRAGWATGSSVLQSGHRTQFHGQMLKAWRGLPARSRFPLVTMACSCDRPCVHIKSTGSFVTQWAHLGYHDFAHSVIKLCASECGDRYPEEWPV